MTFVPANYRSNSLTREFGLKTTIAFEALNGGWDGTAILAQLGLISSRFLLITVNTQTTTICRTTMVFAGKYPGAQYKN